MAADIERIRADGADMFFLRDFNLRNYAADRLESKIDIRRRAARREYEYEEDSFRLLWTLWRIALPLAFVTGIPAGKILRGPQSPQFIPPRRLCLWFARVTGGFSYHHMGKILMVDHSTVRLAFLRVEDEMGRGQGDLVSLFKDALIAERELLHAGS